MKKKLTPRLPKDEKEFLEKGFMGNFSKNEKFVTDGRIMILAAEVVPGMLFKQEDFFLWNGGKEPKEASMQQCWDDAVNSERVPAHFIGVAKPYGKESELVVAAMRDDNQRVFILDPYILKFAMAAVKADSITCDAGPEYDRKSSVLLREGKAVAVIMPMRYRADMLEAYDLTVPAISLSEV